MDEWINEQPAKETLGRCRPSLAGGDASRAEDLFCLRGAGLDLLPVVIGLCRVALWRFPGRTLSSLGLFPLQHLPGGAVESRTKAPPPEKAREWFSPGARFPRAATGAD